MHPLDPVGPLSFVAIRSTAIMRTRRTTYHQTSRTPAAVLALDVMRPVDAFGVGRTSPLDDPARWLRPTLLLLAAAAGLVVLLGASAPVSIV